MKTVHLVFNAHLDPVWLWPWQAALDEALGTCRSACDRLDAHPDVVFTRGEAWVYRQIEQIDPALFARIREHVQAGRWEIVGGWWIQPDCNQPSHWGLERQIELGKRYFLESFGQFPRIAYNVNLFGHTAALPSLMRAAGQDRYVMMRPQEYEHALPSRLFRWRGYEGEPEVVVFRIAGGYQVRHINVGHVEYSLTELPEGVEHTMCFVGAGDHGGGPTEAQIAWCREHENAIEGARLVFSSPSRFFSAVEKQLAGLPLVTGELQMHAVGCYSVCRSIKKAVRTGEHRLRQLELVKDVSVTDAQIRAAWEDVCFNQFHDTLGGTCLPSAYPILLGQLGGAEALADRGIQTALRRKYAALPDDELQRIVAFNASDASYEGYVEYEPWLEWQQWKPGWTLLDRQGEAIPFQVLQSEALTEVPRLLFRTEIAPLDMAIARIQRGDFPVAAPVMVTASATQIASIRGCASPRVKCAFRKQRSRPGSICSTIIPTPGRTASTATSRDPSSRRTGTTLRWSMTAPLSASLMQTGTIGKSSLKAEWRVYAQERFAELMLEVNWQEEFKILKLTLGLPEPADSRKDGVPGGWLDRELSGGEVPVRDGLLLGSGERARLGIVCPDVWAADATPSRVRLSTLLRSPWMNWHDPHKPTFARHTVADQGVHPFRFRFYCDNMVSTAELDHQAFMLQRPLIIGDRTRGMPESVLHP